MRYFYFDDMAFFHTHIITGPIQSRRLGLSLGVNLLPTTLKICNYDCVYCECGWDKVLKADPDRLPSCEEIEKALHTALEKMAKEGQRPDSITFSGNGEPTLHPDFPAIAEMTERSARSFFPGNPPFVTVISNATQIMRSEIRDALSHCSKVLLKLDAGTPRMYARINRLRTGFSLGSNKVNVFPEDFYPELVRSLVLYPHPFTLQTLLFRGEHEGELLDNTSGYEWAAYVDQVKKIRPKAIMIYGLDRETPARKLEKLSREELEEKAEFLRREGFSDVRAFF